MEDLFRAYAPYLYLHPDEEYLPSSVDWFFSNGTLLYMKGEESRPVRIEPGGANLPKGGDPAGLYWLDLPADQGGRDGVSYGHIASAEVYVHFKPGVENMMFTDIQYSGGKWVDASLLHFESGNRFAWYSSRNGHAGNDETGLYLQGLWNGFGIRNDWARSNKVVASEGEAEAVAEPPWLSYGSKWGPTKHYDTVAEVRKFLLGKLKKLLDKLMKVIDEVYGTNGPT
ncbi:hypothetical protein SASPL_141187 [Salvia splendens]|uniref:Uncharacterized protein n=1 Tax=Salvia splendens TaxID=180675 RepID=A0A8X8WTK6_SALSN|nr:hypothetical protein SASPL_141187 [Salvia splendens]